MFKIVSRDEQKQDLRQKMLKIVSRDEQKQDLRQKMLKIVRCVSATATDVRT
ncbi:MAG: hypothetical protein IKI85_02055 [Bacteroidales bacterium]|nr:hypothetical protein [Bacteroidales bacterium]